jgi:hypothetical protein
MLTRLLPILPLLLCPLLMLACLWAMGGRGARAALDQDGRVAELERELAAPHVDAAGAFTPAPRPDHTPEMRPQRHQG